MRKRDKNEDTAWSGIKLSESHRQDRRVARLIATATDELTGLRKGGPYKQKYHENMQRMHADTEWLAAWKHYHLLYTNIDSLVQLSTGMSE